MSDFINCLLSYLNCLLSYLNNNTGVVAGISALISAIAVTVAICFNIKTQKRYEESMKPRLSMRLNNYGGYLYLLIENTGGGAAKNLRVLLKSKIVDGEMTALDDRKAPPAADLYPNESIEIAVDHLFKPDVMTFLPDSYPVVVVKVAYKIYGIKKQQQYERKVSKSKLWDMRVRADVSLDSGEKANIQRIAEAAHRTANYMEGRQYSYDDYFSDEDLNAVPHSSFHNDLQRAIHSTTPVDIITSDAIREAMSNESDESE